MPYRKCPNRKCNQIYYSADTIENKTWECDVCKSDITTDHKIIIKIKNKK